MQLGEIDVLATDVQVLAPDHAEGRLGELPGDIRRRVGEREPERLGQQRIPGEQPDGFAELGPRAGTAPPLPVVVHAGEVVVDERERMDELERGRRRKCFFGVAACRLGGREADHRANALAADEGVAHRRLETGELRRQRELAEIAGCEVT